jgi:hypothetical protein
MSQSVQSSAGPGNDIDCRQTDDGKREDDLHYPGAGHGFLEQQTHDSTYLGSSNFRTVCNPRGRPRPQ